MKGKEIPLGARILTVVDTIDAITSDRPYRPARSMGVAIQEIVREAGRQFDPDVVATVVEILGEQWAESDSGEARWPLVDTPSPTQALRAVRRREKDRASRARS